MPRDAQGKSTLELEISPLFALDAEDVAKNVPAGTRLDTGKTSLYFGERRGVSPACE